MAKDQAQMTIGMLGEATSVGAETIRYYERIGILPAPARSAGGYRMYKPEHVRRLNFIRRGRELGLSLDAVRELLSLASDRLKPCTRVDRLVQEHIHDLDHKIEGLQQLRGALQRLSDSCRGSTRVADCRILEALQEADETLAGPPVACADEACTDRGPAKPSGKPKKGK
jgi:DNA-binding transcriptional MerR regulator